MICSSVNLLFFMSVILLVDGLPLHYVGTAGREQVILAVIDQGLDISRVFAQPRTIASALLWKFHYR